MMQKFNLNLVFCLKDKEPLYNSETAGCWLDICVVGPCSDQIRYNLSLPALLMSFLVNFVKLNFDKV